MKPRRRKRRSRALRRASIGSGTWAAQVSKEHPVDKGDASSAAGVAANLPRRAPSNSMRCAYRYTVKTTTPESLLPLPSTAFHVLVALAEEDRHGYAVIKEV